MRKRGRQVSLFFLKKSFPLGFCLLLCVRPRAVPLCRAESEIFTEIASFAIGYIFGLGFPASVVGVFIVEFAVSAAVEITATVGALVLPGYLPIQGQSFLTMKTDIGHGFLLSSISYSLPAIMTIRFDRGPAVLYVSIAMLLLLCWW